jgi:ubiquinone/menaquinone biosynthesis C-methylase UbiE
MDAEFLARCGASVVCSDLSLASARRARARAIRFDVPITPIVADIEQLPFSDGSVDLVYVHDGLRHIVDPYRGLTEMVRVARRAVSVSEPAEGALTRLSVRLGLALEQEPAGNRVARLDQRRLRRALHSHRLRVVRVERYLMQAWKAPSE